MKPNILIIVVDSLRADHMSCYGYRRNTTPAIDRLAAEGCLFENAISAAPFSPASYASLFSNLYPHQHGVNGDTIRVWPNRFTRLAETMKNNGYFTFGVSNNDFVSKQCNSIQGFDDFVDVWDPGWYLRQHQRLIRVARRHLGNERARRLETNRLQCAVKGNSLHSMRIVQSRIHDSTRPFFGFVVLMDPHVPYNRKRRRFIDQPKDTNVFMKELNSGKMWAKCMAFRQSPPTQTLRAALDCYDSEIWHADSCIGTLCDWLRESEILDETVLIITADHGEAFGEHGVWGHGFALDDCLTRVPLVMRCPLYWSAGSRSPALVQLHDVHDLSVSISATGRPRLDQCPYCLTQARDPGWPGRPYAFSEMPVQTETLRMLQNLNPGFLPGNWGQSMWSIRTREWRYTEYDSGECELYNLRTGSAGTTSVHNDHPDVCMKLRRQLEAHRNDSPHDKPAEQASSDLDAIVRERLRSLGYIE